MEQLDDNGAGAQDALLVDGVCGYEAYLDEHKIACDKLKMVRARLRFESCYYGIEEIDHDGYGYRGS